MKNPFVWLAALAVICFASISSAETVYYWTDENGVRHFSNTGAPPDVEDVGAIAGSSSPPETDASAEAPEAPPPANQEDENLGDTPDSTESPSNVREQFENARREEVARKSEEERRRLQSEIAQIEERGLSRTFTEGMRAARLEPLKEQLALLEADPVQYFRMKQQGAFTQGGRTSSNCD